MENSKKKDMETVLALLPQTLVHETEDGYSGVLTLDISTIKTEAAGYGSSSQTVTTTRQYPNLSSADMSGIPKTVEDGGRTYNYSSVSWQDGTVEVIDGVEIPMTYTANVTYTATQTGSYVTGYTIEAEYTGEAFREGVSDVLYTVIFAGEEIPAPTPSPSPTPTPVPTAAPESDVAEEDSEPPQKNIFLYSVLAIAGFLLLAALIFSLKKFKENKLYEEDGYDDADYFSDDDSDDSGLGF